MHYPLPSELSSRGRCNPSLNVTCDVTKTLECIKIMKVNIYLFPCNFNGFYLSLSKNTCLNSNHVT